MSDLKLLAAHIEAVLFSSGDPLSAEKICAALGITKKELKEAAEYLDEKYDKKNSGIEMLRLNDCYQLAVKKQYASDVKAVLEIKKGASLSPAAMEVLTIAAYNQPVTKAFVEHVRGVDSSSVVNFLRAFGLSSLEDLPPLPDRKEQLSFDDDMNIVDESEQDG